MTPRRTKLLVLLSEIRIVLAEQRPELTGVVQVDRVAELMNQHVPDQVFWDEEQFLVHTDAPALRAAGPSGLLGLHENTIELKIILLR